MENPQKEFLLSFGWNEHFEKQIEGLDLTGRFIGRVINEEKSNYRVQLASDVMMLGLVTGKQIYEASGRQDFPAVGDWVICEDSGASDRVMIISVLNRKSIIERKVAGETTESQVIATNVDWMLIATSLNEDLNLNRVERYLTLSLNAGASPLLIFTKTDLTENLDAIKSEIDLRFTGFPIFYVSVFDKISLEALRSCMKPGSTSVIVGSSGVGKSTLINSLMNSEVARTQGIREGDSKGRHTTTSRQLFVAPTGALFIDTPGMRELQLLTDDQGVTDLFADVEELAASCRFSDCTHATEPGCKVKAALEDGSLLSERWESYRKLLAEVRFQQRKQSKALQAQEKSKWKKLNMEAKARSESKRK